MDGEIDQLLGKLRDIEEALERKLEARRAAFRYQIERGRAEFEAHAVAEHRRLRVGLMRFLRGSPIISIVTAPFVYVLVVPLMALDLSVAIYQLVCFPIWGVRRVRRSDYVVIDRHRLAYLNGIEKLNCVYCGYANGLIALLREVASRTEQFWCPIKHALRIKGAHPRYRHFLEYGDAAAYRDHLRAIRDEVKRI